MFIDINMGTLRKTQQGLLIMDTNKNFMYMNTEQGLILNMQNLTEYRLLFAMVINEQEKSGK
jgi:hypothetical protein